jgi:anti-anti-sigma factor
MTELPGYSCEVCTHAGEWRISFGGEIDMATTPLVDAVLRLAQADALTVQLNLQDVSFIDSSGVALLLRAQRRAHNNQNEFALSDPAAPVRRLLELCAVEPALDIRDEEPWDHDDWVRRHALIATDLEGTVIHWNRDAEALYGYGAQAALGRHARDLLVAPADNDDARTTVQSLRTQGRWQGAFNVARCDGTTFRAWVRDIVMHDGNGRPCGLLGLSVAMTELPSAVDPAPRRAA